MNKEQPPIKTLPVVHTSSSPAPRESSPSADEGDEEEEEEEDVPDLPLFSPPDAVSENLPVSPNVDFCSYADLICKITARLGITTSQPQTPIDDMFFEVLQSKSSSILALPLFKLLLDSIKTSRSKPVSVPVSYKKLDHMYRVQETSAESLFTHPNPNSIEVSSSSKSRHHQTAPQDKEGKKMDAYGPKLLHRFTRHKIMQLCSLHGTFHSFSI